MTILVDLKPAYLMALCQSGDGGVVCLQCKHVARSRLARVAAIDKAVRGAVNGHNHLEEEEKSK